ncbi:MAG TPA: HAD-IIA family hydrolase [Nocardioides sp.]|nr:HAD-IIA family hydrolase [Nocardioides sp.]
MSTTPLPGTLRASAEPLCHAYDVAMLDLDGVVYVGGDAVPGASDHLASARREGIRLAFITNNAARAPHDVARHLSDLGIPAGAADVVTSAQAAAGLAAERFGRDARIGCVGGPGLAWALEDAGLVVVGPDESPDAVVTGYGPEVPWHRIMRAATIVKAGVPWIASNTDATIPTSYGVAPGHGALVDLIAAFAGVRPEVAGKPARPLLDETVHRMAANRPLMVGDRLDTDIVGGRNAGVDSLLVLTGVTGLEELVAARSDERPAYLARDLEGLVATHPEVRPSGGSWTTGGWTGSTEAGRLRVDGNGSGDDWWRVAAAASWAHLDRTGDVVDVAGLGIPEVAAIPR